MVAESAEEDGTGQFITVGVKMTGFFILTPYELKEPVMFSEKENGA